MAKRRGGRWYNFKAFVGFWGTASTIKDMLLTVVVGGGVVVTIISGYIVRFSLIERIALGIVASVVIFAIFRVIAWWLIRGRKPRVEFYESRQELNEKRGGIEGELATVKQIWIATWAGTYLHENPHLLTSETTKIKRLVLLNPDYPALKDFSGLVDTKYENYRTTILDNSERAIGNNILVWWVNRPIDGMTVANPEKKDGYGWVRIETMPYPAASKDMSYIIYEDERKDLYNRLLECYENLTKGAPVTSAMIAAKRGLESRGRGQ